MIHDPDVKKCEQLKDWYQCGGRRKLNINYNLALDPLH